MEEDPKNEMYTFQRRGFCKPKPSSHQPPHHQGYNCLIRPKIDHEKLKEEAKDQWIHRLYNKLNGCGCCKANCLSKPSILESLDFIYDSWSCETLDQKRDKLIHLLSICEREEKSDNTCKINGRYYEIYLQTVNGSSHVCRQAFLDLTRTGHETIESFFQKNRVDQRHHPKQTKKITVLDIVKEFFDLHVELTQDEHFPSYWRCLNYYHQVDVLNELNRLRSETIETGEE